jgi:hypothetical protein
MKFIKLLDPRGVTLSEPGLTIAKQALQAREMFPSLVSQSRLSYWRVGDPVAFDGVRFLIGLAPTFSLPDLRFADVLNESLATQPRPDLTVDVFDVDDLQQGQLMPAYFPGLKGISSTPVVGIWNHGQLMDVRTGAEAMNLVLQRLSIDETAEKIVKSVRPPSNALLDD